jgi:trans-aconitate methyltransferase
MKPPCPVCDGTSLETLEDVDISKQHYFYAPDDLDTQRRLTEAAAAAAVSYQMVRCNACSLEFSVPLIAPSAEWYSIAYRALKLYPAERWEFNEVLKRIRPPSEKLFEIGCGSGTFLEKCRANGISAQGMDFAKDAIDECLSKGLDVSILKLGDSPDVKLRGRFSHINAFHVLEHLEDPQSLFKLGSELAAEQCHLWISVPGELRPSRRFGEKDFLDQPPHHMTRWSAKAFAAMGKSTGWSLAEVLYEPISFRSAIWSISVASAIYKKSGLGNRSPFLEQLLRIALLPYATVKRFTTESPLTGFSILAHFVKRNPS